MKVTVTRAAMRGSKGTPQVLVEYSHMPGRERGPWEWTEAIRDLRVAGKLSPLDARNLVLDALANGTADIETKTP